MIRMVRDIENDAIKVVIKMSRSEYTIMTGLPDQQFSHMIKANSRSYYITAFAVAAFQFWLTFVAWAASLVKTSP